MKKMFILGLIMINFMGCAWLKDFLPKKSNEANSEKAATESRRLQTENEIEAIKADDSYYVGIGYGEISEGYSPAVSAARSEAINNLATTIRSEVTIDMKRTISNLSTISQDGYSEREQELIEEKSSIYTDLMLNNIQGDKHYDDYPRQGVITYIVKKSKAEYNQQVKKELADNKKMITDIIRAGNDNFTSGNYLSALHKWIMAKETIKSIFGNLPLKADIETADKEVNLAAYLNNRVTSFFADLQIVAINSDNFVYDAQGSLDRNPNLQVRFFDKDRAEQSVGKLPLKVTVTEGLAQASSELTTGNYGQVELMIKNIDGSFANTNIRVEIDLDRIDNLTQNFSIPPTSTLSLNMKRMKTIAIAIAFNNNGKISNPSNLMQSIKTQITAQGFAVVEYNLAKENIDSIDLKLINSTNADYFINLYLASLDAATVGGYKNMYKATCSGAVSLFKLPGGANIATEVLTAEEGLGASANSASQNAYGKTISKLKNKTAAILNRVK